MIDVSKMGFYILKSFCRFRMLRIIKMRISIKSNKQINSNIQNHEGNKYPVKINSFGIKIKQHYF